MSLFRKGVVSSNENMGEELEEFTFNSTIRVQERGALTWIAFIFQVLLGTLFLSLCAQISFNLPITPIPITFQTFGVFVLVLFQGRRAVYSVFAYLVEASLGLPVLARGMANPFWYSSPGSFYLYGFFVGAFFMSRILFSSEQKATESPSMLRMILAVLVCQVMIWFSGWIGFAYMLGSKKAYLIAVAPFIVGSLFKMALAITLARPLFYLKKQLRLLLEKIA